MNKQDLNSGYKQSIFGLIPKEWNSTKLGELSSITTGKLDANAMVEDGEYSFFTCSKNVYKTNTYSFEGESLLIAGNGDVGEVKYYNGKFDAYQRTYVLQNMGDMTLYLYFYLSYFLPKKVYKETNKGAMPYIKLSTLTDMPIYFPNNYSEQKNIIKILGIIDKSVKKTEDMIEKLKLRNKGLEQKLLSNSNWNCKSIKEIATEYSKRNKDNKDVTVLSCTKYDGLVPSLEYFGKQIFSDNLTTYKIVPFGYFAYATNHIEEGSIGYQDKYEEAIISPMYTIFKTSDEINNYFLFRILKTHKYIHEYKKRMEGSVDRRGGLRWNIFSEIIVPIPSIQEQNKIVEILDKADNQLKLYVKKLEKLQELKKGLMQQLLTGKVRVKEFRI